MTFFGYIVGGFFVMGVSSYHLLRKSHVSLFSKSFRIALIFALAFSIGEVIVGDFHGKEVGRTQPAKLAAIESQWETVKGAPFSMLLIPDAANERNSVEMFQIPKFLSFLVYDHWDAEIKGLKEWPKADRPPVALIFWSFRIMVGLGFLFALLTVIGWFKRNRLERCRWYLTIMMYAIPLPYLAAELGWIVTEVGRQPWIVYGVMRTADAVSPIPASHVAISLTAFIALYSLLGLMAFALMARVIRQGPRELPAGSAVGRGV